MLGTADYLAPEQALNSHTVDAGPTSTASAARCTFLLTGHPPFPEGTLPQRLMMHQTKEPAAISIDRPDVPQALVDICKRMMAKKVAKRYQTAAEVRDVMAAWLAGSNRSAAPARASDTAKIALAAVIADDAGGDIARLPQARPLPSDTPRPSRFPRSRRATPGDTLANSDSNVPTRAERNPSAESSGGRKLRVARSLGEQQASNESGSFLINVDDPIARRFESDSNVSSIGWRRRRQRSARIYIAAAVAGLVAVALLIGIAVTSG